MSRTFVKQLYRRLPGLLESGVLDPVSVGRIREHYGPEPEGSGRRVLVVFFGVVGALLIGAGITLLLGHNWNELGRPTRTIIAFLPLLAGQAAALYTLLKAPDSLAWREGAGTFLFLSVGTCIALIAQTYHMPGNMDTFLLTWMVIALPLAYALRSVLPAILYMVGITCWAGHRQWAAGQASAYWLLMALVIPLVWMTAREHRYGGRAVFLRWAMLISIACGLGITLEKALPGLWIPVYLCFFSLIYLIGGGRLDEADSMWQQPMRVLGAGGVAVMAWLLTWEWCWHEIGWRYYRYGHRFNEWAALTDYVILAVLLTATLVFLVTCVRKKRAADLLLGSAAVVGLLGYGSVAMWRGEGGAMILFNLYTLVIALGLVIVGLKGNRLSRFNGGMVLFAALVTARFFDEDLPFVLKGLVFIALGIGFLVCNILIVRRKGAVR